MKHMILPVVAMTLVMSLHGQAVNEKDLTPEEKAIYNPLKAKANIDPGVKKANEKLRVLTIEKISKTDPALKPLAEKILPPPAVNPKDLPADEKNKWKKANAEIDKDPDIVKANSDIQQAKLDAMVKLNPAVKPILEKLYPPAGASAAPAAAAPAAADGADAAQ